MVQRHKKQIPMVWFYEWPQDIRDQFCSSSNKTGTLTISDLELTGILLHWLVLEHIVDIATLRNTPRRRVTTSLPSLGCTNSEQARHLWQHEYSGLLLSANRAALLSVEHISGIYNKMADVGSQRHSLDCTIFLTNFSAMFPPPQGEFWTMFLLSNKIT
jgi:hypothetical protein